MLAPITIRYPFRPARQSLACGEVADLFGLGNAEAPHIIAENITLDIQPNDLVLFTGPSGSGKSSLMREVAKQLQAVDAMALQLPDVPLVDALPGSVEVRLGWLAAAGLGEARLLLRTPNELSDGQRYRFRIAYAFATGAATICLDEFAAVLDRPLAKVLAFNLRKLVTRTGIGVLCATTHDDLHDDLNPDVVVRCLGDGAVTRVRGAAKKNESASPTSFGCRMAPVPTGRTSHGGIIDRTGSRSSAG
jgi:uncharacterized protein